MHDKLEELKKDFYKMLEKVNIEAYNPLSYDFQKLLNIGLMWYLLRKMDKIQENVFEDDYEEAKEEIMGADKYYNMYKEHKDPTLKSMASDELKHAHYFLDKIRLSDKTPKQKNTYDDLLKWYNAMIGEINK